MPFIGESQHLAVELFRGRLRVSYDVGNYPVSTMFSYELVADGNYHTVEILAIKKNFTLRVDGGLARSIVNEGPNEFLNVRSPLHIAGVPEETGNKAWKQWHLRNTTSFIGKIFQITVSIPLVRSQSDRILQLCGLFFWTKKFVRYENPHSIEFYTA